ncbi:hypothetical protein [Paraburkholderia sp. J67]|uniref:hypothetical protein n=1 Tax=Paraburkholderia sp. J67 TaxID=2805435 RepID=UPI002ABDF686|nr:hypothetical protein [Paraburkholderia sp. J67]
MRHAKLQTVLSLIYFFLCSVSIAKTDPVCLKHLGGGSGDDQCYQDLINDLILDNQRLFKSILTTIPNGNIHEKLLEEYMKSQDRGIQYCELQRNAGAKWKVEHDGSMFPALYAQCVYDIRKNQNQFLNDLAEMAYW